MCCTERETDWHRKERRWTTLNTTITTTNGNHSPTRQPTLRLSSLINRPTYEATHVSVSNFSVFDCSNKSQRENLRWVGFAITYEYDTTHPRTHPLSSAVGCSIQRVDDRPGRLRVHTTSNFRLHTRFFYEYIC